MKPPVVVHLIDGLSVGGAESALFRLVSDPAMSGEACSVIAFMEGGENLDLMREAGVRVESLGLARGQVSLGAFMTLRRRLAALRPDIVVTWSATADLVGTLIAPLCGSPRVIWNIRQSALRPGDCSRITSWAIRICAWLSRRMPLIVANADAARDAHEAMGYHPNAWTIIPNGFDLQEFKPNPAARRELRDELGIDSNTPLVGIAGRSYPGKDHATFVRAAEAMAERRPDVHYLMAGQGLDSANEALKQLAPRLVDARGLHLLGLRHDMPRVLAALDVFTLTSLVEGCPNVVGEAMACGVPCVVTQSAGDGPAMVGDTGRVIPSRDPPALTEAWVDCLSLKADERTKLAASARARAEACYSLDAMRGRYRTLYARIQEGSA